MTKITSEITGHKSSQTTVINQLGFFARRHKKKKKKKTKQTPRPGRLYLPSYLLNTFLVLKIKFSNARIPGQKTDEKLSFHFVRLFLTSNLPSRSNGDDAQVSANETEASASFLNFCLPITLPCVSNIKYALNYAIETGHPMNKLCVEQFFVFYKSIASYLYECRNGTQQTFVWLTLMSSP